MKDIIVRFIPHKVQRYDTCGDWFEEPYSHKICVSAELSDKEQFLVALHEFVEMGLCHFQGVSESSVDEFDTNYKGEGEPGEDPKAPYRNQHEIAEYIEQLIATELGVNWNEYSLNVKNL